MYKDITTIEESLIQRNIKVFIFVTALRQRILFEFVSFQQCRGPATFIRPAIAMKQSRFSAADDCG